MVLDKLKYGAINNKKIIFFLTVLGLIALISGAIFITILSKSDQSLVKDYMSNFMDNIFNNYNYKSTLQTTLINNIGYVILVWLLGISIVGTIITVFLYFSKFFVLSFSISSFILTYKLKGLLFAILYIIPCHLINIVAYLLLTLYSIKMSNNLIYSIFKKKDVNFKKIINRYLVILGICLIFVIISSLYETFIIPIIFQKLSFLVK